MSVTASDASTSPSIGPKTPAKPVFNRGDSFVGKYCMLKTIGRGNFAKVKLARHMLTNQRVAIKVIDKTKLDKSGLRKMYREVNMLKLLRHPNIVRLYEVIEDDVTLYLVMEHMSGGEVFDYLVSNGKMKEKEARHMFRQIVSAVHYCHKHGVVHRDLKAENLLLDEKLNVKIADFGFSNTFAEGNKLDTFCGSPPYAAPELFRGERYGGPEVDVWSLGVVLYTVVSGSLPFDGRNLKEVRERVLSGKYRVPFFMSHECHQFLRKLLVPASKRASIDVVVGDKWLNTGYDRSPVISPTPCPKLDETKLDLMVTMGYKRAAVIDSVEKRKFDEIMATYFIIDSKIMNIMTKSSTPRRSRTHSAVESTVSSLSNSLHQKPPLRKKSGSHASTEGPPLDCLAGKKESFRTKINSFNAKVAEYEAHDKIIRGNVSFRPILDEYAGLSVETRNDETMSLTSFVPSARKSYPRPTTNRAADLRVVTAKSAHKTSFGAYDPPFRTNVKGAVAAFDEAAKRSTLPITRKDSFSASENRLGFKLPPKKTIKKPAEEEEDRPRVLRFTWSMKTTTTMAPLDILNEIFRVLGDLSIEYEHRDKYVVFCMAGDSTRLDSFVQWDMEICQLPRISLNGVKFKRISGSSSAFKEMAARVSNLLHL